MTLVNLIFMAFCMLIGEEGKEYLLDDRSPEQRQLIGFLHRN